MVILFPSIKQYAYRMSLFQLLIFFFFVTKVPVSALDARPNQYLFCSNCLTLARTWGGGVDATLQVGFVPCTPCF